ncbi:precorrin-6y C5,15-methyltransferase (decarboxylating) subunit CbiE [Sneathiella chinensis]|uniref:Precorrin-6Y C5,15-methyltransferase (Decarboxylating) n=1 Tax=Sneathiella chinensis TaxID=349750 RepID=A0ABQ5U3D9_9PROT|nr:precorrin-6y C5,15-methyltransferase (decarboxylating) subunit CbiE [Sneathiella chinensis]GLQ06170.1 precorrin-6Y C5,15-methyltransferase (decarboxylating) [Sneathiella chinensis]
MKPWLSIIGVGDDGLSNLSADAWAAIEGADLIIGGDRHLAMLPAETTTPTQSWPSPLMKLVENVLARRGDNICILATGDPMNYGIGVTFAKRLAASEMRVLPALSAFSLAAARMGWDLSRTVTLTLHGRPLELILPHLVPGARILALSDNGQTPANVAALLTETGFGPSSLTVLEHMGGTREARQEGTAKDWPASNSEDLNTLAIQVAADPGTPVYPTTPGLPDDAFFHDGQITKQEVRAVTAAALSPLPGERLWDIGAGSGSVGIEWMRCSPLNQAIAVETREDRVRMIERNRLKLGVPGLQIIQGMAPDCLADLPSPDAVFIGGGINTPSLFEACWQALQPGGRLIINTVTTEGEARILALHQSFGGSLTRLNIARSQKIGRFTSWKPFREVTQLRLVKP